MSLPDDDIPLDVAKLAHDADEEIFACRTTSYEAVAEAVVAERERCAKIAETAFPDNATGQFIAAAIRKGEA